MPDHVRATETERLIQVLMSRGSGISRRRFLAGSAALSVPAVLAACGVPGVSPTAAPTAAGPTPRPTQAGSLVFANWPLYIDIDDTTGAYPTLEKFKAETGINYTYTEGINDNEDFFGRIQPDLAAGRSTGYDLIVMTDWMIERLIRLGYVEELDKSRLPNFTANAADLYRDPWWDPGNRFSLAYQSGIVGIGYNPTLTGRPITSFDDLLDPAFAGRVGMFSEMRDTMCLTLLSLGVIPTNATVDDAGRAQQKLLEAAQRGQFRAFYGNDYYDQLAAGNLALTIAWGGDITQMKLYDNPDVEFVIPESGGMRYVDNMVIPSHADHPVDALKMMDFWYDVGNAATLTEYIGYFSPANGVAERIRQDAQAARTAGDTATADQLDIVAGVSSPTADQLQHTYTYKILDVQEERQWNDLFNAVVAG